MVMLLLMWSSNLWVDTYMASIMIEIDDDDDDGGGDDDDDDDNDDDGDVSLPV